MQTPKRFLNLGVYLSGPISLVLVVIFISFSQQESGKIGYVRSNDLIYGYAGMKEAESALTEEAMKKQALVDTLSLDLETDIKEYASNKATLSVENSKLRADTLRQRKNQLRAYSKSIDSFLKEEETKMLTGVFNQINSFVKTYAEENGFAMIYGTTSEGNILYGEPALDVTDELLMNLNQQYNGKSL